MRFKTPVKYTLLFIFSFGLSYPVEAQPKGLTDKELAEYWYARGQTEKALGIALKNWENFQTYGSGIDYAVMLWKSGRRQSSVKVFNQVIKGHPSSWDADIILADFYKQQQNFVAAEKVLKGLYDRMPNDMMAVKSYAGILLAVKKPSDAVAILAGFTPIAKDEFNYYAIYAAANFEAQQWETALASFQKLYTMRPDMLEFQYSAGKCFSKLKRWDEAKALYTELQNQFPEDGEPWKQMGLLEYERENFDRAVEELTIAKGKFESSGNEKGTNDSAYLIDEVAWIHAKSFMGKGQFEEACPRLDTLRNRNGMLRYGFDAAICYREAKQFDMATSVFSDMVEKFPENSSLFSEFYENIKRQNNLAETRENLETHIRKSGYTSPKVMALLALSLLRDGKEQEALTILQKYEPKSPSNETPLSHLFISVNAYRNLNKADKANALIKKAQGQAPDLFRTHNELFDIIPGTKNNGELQLTLTEMYNEFGLNSMVRVKRATLHFGMQNWDKVLPDCERVLKDTTLPKSSYEIGTAKALLQEAKVSIAKRHLKAGKIDEAVNVGLEVYENNPNDLTAVKSYAGILLGVQRADEAVAILESFTPTPDQMFDYQAIYAAANFEAKRFEPALNTYKVLIEMRPELTEFQYSLATCYRKLKRWNEAKALYIGLQSQFPSDGEPWKQMGLMEYERENFDQAVEELNTAINKFQMANNDKGVTDSKNLIDEVKWIGAKSLMGKGQFDIACPQLNALRLKSDMLRYGFDTAICYRESKQFDKANPLFTELMQQHPENPDLFIAFNEGLLQQKDKSNTTAYLESFVQKNGYTSHKIASILSLLHLSAGDEQKALTVLQKYDRSNDSTTPLSHLFISANANRSLGNDDKANALIKEAQREAPDLFGRHPELFDITPGGNNNGELQLILTAMYDAFGLSPMVRIKRASLHLGMGNFDKAIPDCENVQNDATLPDDAYEKRTAKALKQAAGIEIARGLFESEAKDDAVALYYDIYQTDPNDLTAVKSYAGALLGVDRADEAVEILEKFTPKPEEEFNYYAIYAAANFNAKRFEPALNSYKQLIEMRPDLTEFQYSLATCHRKLKQWDKAQGLYTGLQNQFPSDGEPWKQMGLMEYERENFDQAVEEFTTAISKFKTTNNDKGVTDSKNLIDEVKWIGAKSLMGKGQFDIACPQLNALRLKSDMLRYGFDTAICYRESKQFDKANPLFTELMQQHPENPDLFIAFNEGLLQQKDKSNTKAYLENFVQKNGYTSHKIVSILSLLHLSAGDEQKALAVLQKFESGNDSTTPLSHLFISANANRSLGNDDKANALIKEAQREAPDLFGRHPELFDITPGGNNNGELQLILTAMYDAFGLSPMVRIKRASLHLGMGNFDKAIPDCENVQNDATLPDDAYEKRTAKALKQAAKIEIARGLFESEAKDEAVALYYDIYQTDPDDLTAVKSYAGILLGVQRADEAVAILESFTPTPDQMFDYQAIYAAANFEAKRFEPALNTYKVLIEMRPDLTEFQYSLATCYRKLKQWDKAKTLYTGLQNQFPSDGEPWKQMGLMEYERENFDQAVEELTTAISKFKTTNNDKGVTDSKI